MFYGVKEFRKNVNFIHFRHSVFKTQVNIYVYICPAMELSYNSFQCSHVVNIKWTFAILEINSLNS